MQSLLATQPPVSTLSWRTARRPKLHFGNRVEAGDTVSFQKPSPAYVPKLDRPFPGKKLGLTLSVATEQDAKAVVDFCLQRMKAEYGDVQTEEQQQAMLTYVMQVIQAHTQSDPTLVSSEPLASKVFLIKDKSGELVGISAVHQFPNFLNCAFFPMTFLMPEYQRKGIGSWLWDERLAIVKEAGVNLMAVEAKEPTIPLASKRGFQVVEKPHCENTWMELDLRTPLEKEQNVVYVFPADVAQRIQKECLVVGSPNQYGWVPVVNVRGLLHLKRDQQGPIDIKSTQGEIIFTIDNPKADCVHVKNSEGDVVASLQMPPAQNVKK